MTLQQLRLGSQQRVATIPHCVEQAAGENATVSAVVGRPLQPGLDLRGCRVRHEQGAEWRDDGLTMSERDGFGRLPAIGGDHLDRVAADLDEDAAVDREGDAEFFHLGPNRLGQLRCLDQLRIRRGDERSGRELSISALEAQQRQRRPGDAELLHAPENDVVVTRLAHVLERALDPGHRTLEDGRAEGSGPPAHAVELGCATGRHPTAQRFLIGRQDVDAARGGIPEPHEAPRAPRGKKGDQRRIQGDRSERSDDHAFRDSGLGHSGDDGYPRRVVPERLAEQCGVDRRVAGLATRIAEKHNGGLVVDRMKETPLWRVVCTRASTDEESIVHQPICSPAPGSPRRRRVRLFSDSTTSSKIPALGRAGFLELADYARPTDTLTVSELYRLYGFRPTLPHRVARPARAGPGSISSPGPASPLSPAATSSDAWPSAPPLGRPLPGRPDRPTPAIVAAEADARVESPATLPGTWPSTTA